MDWQNQNGNPYNNGNWQYRPAPVKPRGDGMATAAMVLGIISIACLFFMQIYVPFITAGIGIVPVSYTPLTLPTILRV